MTSNFVQNSFFVLGHAYFAKGSHNAKKTTNIPDHTNYASVAVPNPKASETCKP